MGPTERWMVTTLLAFPAAFGGYLIAHRWRALALRRWLLRDGVRAEAVVRGLEQRGMRPAARSYWATLEFPLADGSWHQVQCETSGRFYRFHSGGSRTLVSYRRGSPDVVTVVEDESLSAKRRADIVFGIGAIILAVAGMLHHWR